MDVGRGLGIGEALTVVVKASTLMERKWESCMLTCL